MGPGKGSGLGPGSGGGVGGGRADKDKADQELQDLVNEYQRTARGGSIAGLLPIDVPFTALGPFIYLAAELAPEGKTPEARFSFKREVK